MDIHTPSAADYYVVGSSSGPYFTSGFTDVVVRVVKGYHRVDPGGMGSVKYGGNYAASLISQLQMAGKGFSRVCFLDTYKKECLGELGGMNMFVVMAGSTVRIPELTDIILEGGAHSAICKMLRSQGTPVREEVVALDELVAGTRSGEIAEVFACDAAAVITPITRLANNGFDMKLPIGETTKRTHKQLADIQMGYT